jgi:hypothetical protein
MTALAGAPAGAAAAAPLDVYPTMRMRRLGSIVVVQPQRGGAAAAPSLTVDLETGSLALAETPFLEEADSAPVLGVLGMAVLEAGPALVVVTAAERAGELRGHPLLRATRVEVLAETRAPRWKDADRRFLALLRAALDPRRHGRGLHLALGGDPTLSQQRWAAAAAAAPPRAAEHWRRADEELTWNRALARPLLDAGAAAFVPTAFLGFVGRIESVPLAHGGARRTLTLTLLARRATRRAGTRQWRRGVDLGGAAANHVESEQLLELAEPSTGEVVRSALVVARGSIPLLWSQAPCLKYKIPILLAPAGRSDAPFEAHARALLARHGAVTAVNLANQTGREGRLSAALAAAAAAAAPRLPGFRLVPFDFHKHCGAANYANLERLWADVGADAAAFGTWLRDDAAARAAPSSLALPPAEQAGAFRVNCVDSLDRTNVVQGLLGRRALEGLLGRLGLLAPGAPLAAASAPLEAAFRAAWADHGDAVARQYAGSGAMKSQFTRTGKRDAAGLADDGAKALARYYLNNFRDGRKQDALDLATGAYAVVPGRSAPFRARASPALPLLAAAALALAAAAAARRPDAAGGPAPGQAGALLALAVAIVAAVLRFGRQLVDAPQLLPGAVSPWH